MKIFLVLLAPILCAAAQQKVDPLVLVDETVEQTPSRVVECEGDPLDSVTVANAYGRFAAKPDLVAVATALASEFNLPPCHTQVTKLEHRLLDYWPEVFYVYSGRGFGRTYILAVRDEKGQLERLNPTAEDFGAVYRNIFWDPEATDEESLYSYASFFIKLLYYTRATSFLPSYEVADYVVRQEWVGLRDRPVDSLRSLEWPHPTMSHLGAEAEAETFIWKDVIGVVVRIKLKIGPDGRLSWREELFGKLERD